MNNDIKKISNFQEVIDLCIKQLKFRKGMTIRRILFWSLDLLDELLSTKQINETQYKEFLKKRKEMEDMIK